MRKTIIFIFLVSFFISTPLLVATEANDNDSINKEVNKLLSQIAPETKTFTWSCTTVSKFPLNHIANGAFHVVDECRVYTDLKKEFKITCEYSILPVTNSATKCYLGW